MPDDPITIEFDNRLSELLAAARLYYRSTLWHVADRVVSLLLAFCAVTLIYLGGIAPLPVILIVLAIGEWFNVLSPRPIVMRYFFWRNPKLFETYRLTFAEEGIGFKTASINSQIAWTHYNRILENDALILLIFGTRMYSVIPTRAFQDDGELSRFRELIARKISRHAVAS